MQEISKILDSFVGYVCVKNLNALKTAVGEEEWAFLASLYALGMSKNNLRNFKGGPNFLPDSIDPCHLELPNSRLKSNDKRFRECVAHYADLVEKGGTKNTVFEKNPAVKSVLNKVKAEKNTR